MKYRAELRDLRGREEGKRQGKEVIWVGRRGRNEIQGGACGEGGWNAASVCVVNRTLTPLIFGPLASVPYKCRIALGQR